MKTESVFQPAPSRISDFWDAQWEEDDAIFISDSHGKDPRNEYEVRLDQMTHPWIVEVREDARVFPVREGAEGICGAYMIGTGDDPFVVVNVDAHETLEQLKQTVAHELVHAGQDQRLCEFQAEAAAQGRNEAPGGLPLERVYGPRSLFHVGTMNQDDKGSRGPSWEGGGLSVSLDPDEWTRIAKLGGLPKWEISNPATPALLKVHDLTEEEIENIKTWGREYFTEKTVHSASYEDDEIGGEVTLWFDSKKEADLEGDHVRYNGETTKLVPSDDLVLMTGISPDTDATEGLIMAWAETNGYDGLWWEDEFGPYSAPRGVIFESMIHRWDSRKLT